MAEKKVSGSGSGDPKKDAEKRKWDMEKQNMDAKHQREKEALAKRKELAKKNKKEDTLPYDPIEEASKKAKKLHIMHAAKLISKMKSGHERENAI